MDVFIFVIVLYDSLSNFHKFHVPRFLAQEELRGHFSDRCLGLLSVEALVHVVRVPCNRIHFMALLAGVVAVIIKVMAVVSWLKIQVLSLGFTASSPVAVEITPENVDDFLTLAAACSMCGHTQSSYTAEAVLLHQHVQVKKVEPSSRNAPPVPVRSR